MAAAPVTIDRALEALDRIFAAAKANLLAR